MKMAALLFATLALLAASIEPALAQKSQDVAAARPTQPEGDAQPPKRPRPEGRRPPGGLGPILLQLPPIVFAVPAYEAPPRRPAPAAKPAAKPVQKKAAVSRKAAAKKPPVPRRPAVTVARVVGPYAPGEVLFSAASAASIDAILARHRLTRIEAMPLALAGLTLIRARIAPDAAVPAVLARLQADPAVSLAQPNHLYRLSGESNADLAAVQYAPQKLHAAEAHSLAEGKGVLVAVIDSGVDGAHPELAGAMDPAATARTIGPHGTAIAGIIAARSRMIGISPAARIASFDAFIGRSDTAQGSTADVARSLDRAAAAGAQIVNMSFAGPADPLLALMLAAAKAKGMVLVAAVGNSGPKTAPAFPASDPSVIAVTATDPSDAAYASANAGRSVSVAAPGVDILVPAPGGGYQQLSGTSFAAAHVSGVAALLLGADPGLTPDEIRTLLTRTARDLGRPGRDAIFGAGLVDAEAAVQSVEKRLAAAR